MNELFVSIVLVCGSMVAGFVAFCSFMSRIQRR